MTEDEYLAGIERILELMDVDPMSNAEQSEFDQLVSSLIEYEIQHFPMDDQHDD